MKNNNIKWIECSDKLPELGDYTVLACAMHNKIGYSWIEWDHGTFNVVHVEDYFKDIMNGLDNEGNLLYIKRYLRCGITHWAYVNLPE